jgi:hypothetical protein
MAIDHAALKTELDTDPVSMGYAGNSPGGKAKLLNSEQATPETYFVAIEQDKLLFWAADKEFLILFEDYAATEVNLDATRAFCRGFLDIISSPHTEGLNFNKARHNTMIDALVTATDGGLDTFTAATRTQLKNMGTVNKTRVEELFGVGVRATHRDVHKAEALP